MPDSDPSLHRDQSGSSQIFGYTALALYAAFLSGVASAAYPLHPTDPHWLLGVINTLVNLGVLPLVGICLLLISGRRYPDSDLIWNWLIRSRRLAGPVCLGFLLLLPLQLASTGWALLGPEQPVITNLNLLRSVQRELKQHPDVLPSRRDLRRLLAEPGAAPVTPTAAPNIPANPTPGVDARVGVQPRTEVEPAIPTLERPRILASIDAALTNRSAGLRQRLLRSVQVQIPPMLRNLLQALLLLMAYSGVAMNEPNKGSLLQQLQTSWLRARDDLVSSNRKQREDAADLQRLREERKVREALRILRQAGEIPGSRRRHRGDPPPLDPSTSSERTASGPAEPES
jgi:hypothetical protein